MTDLDNRLRLTSAEGSVVLTADHRYTNLLECFDLQVRRVLLGDGDEDFAAERFVGQVKVLEALAHA